MGGGAEFSSEPNVLAFSCKGVVGACGRTGLTVFHEVQTSKHRMTVVVESGD